MTNAGSSTWKREVEDLARGFSGAYIFGVPLLFTMEMWWIGEYANLWKMATFLALAFVANVGLTYVAGFKRRSTFGTSVNQAVEVVAIGLIAAVVMLLVLNRIRPTDPLDTILGRVVIQAVPLSIGASVANEIFGRRGEKSREGEQQFAQLGAGQALFADVGATIVGGIFVGFSIAPTEEIQMLAAGLDVVHVIAVIGLSLVVSYAIVFASDFDQTLPDGPFQRPITETAFAYIIALLVAIVSLYLFDQIDTGNPLRSVVKQTLVLGIPTTVGGAAGRLVI